MSRPEKQILIQGPQDLQEYLDAPGDEDLKARIREMFQILSANPASGEHVKKKLWPKKYTKQRINNLFRYRIGDQTRFAYTIVDPDAATRIIKILDFFKTHKEYERVFGYD